jgi:hypothetical protein
LIIDDRTRLAYTEIHPDQTSPTVTAFVGRASTAGSSIAGSRRAPQAQRKGRALPTDPRSRMGLRAALPHLKRRAAALPIWLKHYNYTRNHSSVSNRPPITPVRNQPRHNI